MNECAKVIDWQPKWDSGASNPQVFSNGLNTYLIYLIDETDPNWDGTFVTKIVNSSEAQYSLALVEFNGQTFRFGIANDEVFSGLPLWRKGLVVYSAHLVQNSSWIKELKEINKVHPNYNEIIWENFKHFILLFHDQIFEIISKDYRIEIFKTTFEELAKEVATRMNK